MINQNEFVKAKAGQVYAKLDNAVRALIQAQQRYIVRGMSCHTGHVRRVRRSAAKELKAWAVKHGYDPDVVHRDAKDMLELELVSEE